MHKIHKEKHYKLAVTELKKNNKWKRYEHLNLTMFLENTWQWLLYTLTAASTSFPAFFLSKYAFSYSSQPHLAHRQAGLHSLLELATPDELTRPSSLYTPLNPQSVPVPSVRSLKMLTCKYFIFCVYSYDYRKTFISSDLCNVVHICVYEYRQTLFIAVHLCTVMHIIVIHVCTWKIQVYNFFSPGYQMAHQRMRASKLYYIAGIYTW